MIISEVLKLIDGKIVAGEKYLSREVSKAFSSDLMSDVLTLDTDEILLITGLINVQTIRTAEMAEISCIAFVRNKKVTKEMVSLAEVNHMVLIECASSMFSVSGKLYQAGIQPVF
ncbi:MAG: hypothetical protein JXJ22_08005 [Bacteroidales bacterium]|nr:hypothetical protein [Bacteroidales bacterium]